MNTLPAEPVLTQLAELKQLLTSALAAVERALQKSTATPTTHQPIGICIGQTYAAIAEATALALEKAPTRLYLKDGIYGTIIEDPANKKYTFHPMTPERFSTWLEEQGIAYFYTLGKTPQPTKIPTSLSPAQAKIILASDRLRVSTPEIKEIILTRHTGGAGVQTTPAINLSRPGNILTADPTTDWTDPALYA